MNSMNRIDTLFSRAKSANSTTSSSLRPRTTTSVYLDRLKTKVFCRLDRRKYPLQSIHARDVDKALPIEAVETDGDAVEPCVFQTRPRDAGNPSRWS